MQSTRCVLRNLRLGESKQADKKNKKWTRRGERLGFPPCRMPCFRPLKKRRLHWKSIEHNAGAFILSCKHLNCTRAAQYYKKRKKHIFFKGKRMCWTCNMSSYVLYKLYTFPLKGVAKSPSSNYKYHSSTVQLKEYKSACVILQCSSPKT
jgi:hypothetical protein